MIPVWVAILVQPLILDSLPQADQVAERRQSLTAADAFNFQVRRGTIKRGSIMKVLSLEQLLGAILSTNQMLALQQLVFLCVFHHPGSLLVLHPWVLFPLVPVILSFAQIGCFGCWDCYAFCFAELNREALWRVKGWCLQEVSCQNISPLKGDGEFVSAIYPRSRLFEVWITPSTE